MKVREEALSGSDCQDEREWGSEEWEVEKISSVEGGLELVKLEELVRPIYCCWREAIAVFGDGIETEGVWNNLASYCGSSADSLCWFMTSVGMFSC